MRSMSLEADLCNPRLYIPGLDSHATRQKANLRAKSSVLPPNYKKLLPSQSSKVLILDVNTICRIHFVNHLLVFVLNRLALELLGWGQLPVLLREIDGQNGELLNFERIVWDELPVAVGFCDRCCYSFDPLGVLHSLADFRHGRIHELGSSVEIISARLLTVGPDGLQCYHCDVVLFLVADHH